MSVPWFMLNWDYFKVNPTNLLFLSGIVSVCSGLVSVAVTNSDQRHLQGGKDWSDFLFQVHHWGKSRQDLLEENMEGRCLLTGLLAHVQLAFFYSPGWLPRNVHDPPWAAPPNKQLRLSWLWDNQRPANQMWATLQSRLSSQMTLGCAKLTKLTRPVNPHRRP